MRRSRKKQKNPKCKTFDQVTGLNVPFLKQQYEDFVKFDTRPLIEIKNYHISNLNNLIVLQWYWRNTQHELNAIFLSRKKRRLYSNKQNTSYEYTVTTMLSVSPLHTKYKRYRSSVFEMPRIEKNPFSDWAKETSKFKIHLSFKLFLRYLKEKYCIFLKLKTFILPLMGNIEVNAIFNKNVYSEYFVSENVENVCDDLNLPIPSLALNGDVRGHSFINDEHCATLSANDDLKNGKVKIGRIMENKRFLKSESL